MRITRHGLLGTLAAMLIVAGCGGEGGPFDSDSASSRVQFALAGAKTSAGVFVCDEADFADLLVAPDGAGSRTQGLAVQGDCTVDFEVTVPRGLVDFTGQLLGGGRPLMRGRELRFPARKDGFRVLIDLDEIDALEVRTRTVQPVLNARFEFKVRVDGDTIGIDSRDTVRVGALAGGARDITFDPSPCFVVSATTLTDGVPVTLPGDASPEVTIPIPEQEVGDVEFLIDCGASLTLTTETQGTAGADSFPVLFDGVPTGDYIGRNDTITVFGVPPGTLDVTIDPGPDCTANDITSPNPPPPPPYQVPAGGSVQVDFLVLCPSIPQTANLIVETRTGGTPPGNLPSPAFDISVTGPANATASIGANGQRLFGLVPGVFTVDLTPRAPGPGQASCQIAAQTPVPVRVTLVASSPVTVTFAVDCS